MKTIACFGDSLIYGFPFGPRISWITEIEAIHGIRMLNYGVCGDCCDDILTRVKEMYLPEQVKTVLFWGGTNDLLQKRPLQVIVDDLKQVEAFCRDRNFSLTLVLPLLSTDESLNCALNKLREAMIKTFAGRVALLDLQPALGYEQAELETVYLDGVHPTAATYKKMGIYAASLVENGLFETLE